MIESREDSPWDRDVRAFVCQQIKQSEGWDVFAALAVELADEIERARRARAAQTGGFGRCQHVGERNRFERCQLLEGHEGDHKT
jgi:hypothetical protein